MNQKKKDQHDASPRGGGKQKGLVTEAQPGMGSRADDAASAANATKVPKEAADKGKPRATKLAYEEPRPEPRDQPPDSLAHEQERQTGMSGQSSGA